MLNFLTGKGKVKVYGNTHPSSKGAPIPVIYIAVRHRWFDWRINIIDIISFLLVAEKLLTHKEGDFEYDQQHESVRCKLTVPAWAMAAVQERAKELGPLIYAKMKEADQGAQDIVKSLEGSGTPPEALVLLSKMTLLNKYKELHAKVNGYSLTPTLKGEGHGDTVHCMWVLKNLR